MGVTTTLICNPCGREFEANIGGGMRFWLLRCELCGRKQSIPDSTVGPLFYEGNLTHHEEWVAANVPACKCGGRFTFNAKPRCPSCKSDDTREHPAGPTVFYD